MIEQDGTLLVATGSEGDLPDQPDRGRDCSSSPRSIRSRSCACCPRTTDGLPRPGELRWDRRDDAAGFAAKGTYTSPVLDAAQISRFGKMHLHGTLPAGASLKVATRSGNVQEAAADGWSTLER